MVVPVLVVVKFEVLFAKARLVDHFVVTQLTAKLRWFVVVVQSSIVLNDVTVATRSVSLTSWNMFSSAISFNKFHSRFMAKE